MEPLRKCNATAPARIPDFETGPVSTDGASERPHSAGRHNMVSARSVAGNVLDRLVECHYPSHSFACAEPHQDFIGIGAVILSRVLWEHYNGTVFAVE